MADIGSVYAAGRQRIVELAMSVDPSEQEAPVPACPGWSVHDVVAHLTGVCSDVLAGNIEGVTTDPWTHAQVVERRQRPLDEVVKEWSEVGPQVEAMAVHFPGRMADQWVADLTTHEHDVRGALSRPGARAGDAMDISLDFLVTMGLASSLQARGLPPLRVRAADTEWVAGGEATDAAAALETSPFELFRALTGRRSEAQLRRYTWEGDPDAYLTAFAYGPFTTRSTDLVE